MFFATARLHCIAVVAVSTACVRGGFHIDPPECAPIDCVGPGLCELVGAGRLACTCDFGYRNASLFECIKAPTCETDAECQDSDVCTRSWCENGVCRYRADQEGTSCDDGQYCSVDDRCVGGFCVGDTRDCAGPTAVCLLGTCDEINDSCVMAPTNEGQACDDGDYCSVGETCTDGTCNGGSARDCSSAGDTCNDGVCDEALARCVAQAANDGQPCDDGDPCSPNDLCAAGSCAAGPVTLDGDSDGYVDGACPGGDDCRDDVQAIHPGASEICDGVDNDCDQTSVDGTDAATFGDACDGPDNDLCLEGNVICNGVALICDDASGDNQDLCDGADNDCDPATADGYAEPTFGDPCDGNDTDLCAEGNIACNGTVLFCDDATGDTPDLCDGGDNDCNPGTVDGSDEATFGDACDGPDNDLCLEGNVICNGVALICDDASGDNQDLCDGADNDCDSGTVDGSAEATFGDLCDGSDADLCNEGNIACNGTALYCDDASGDTLDLCDGANNDCDGTTLDGSGEATFGDACDGSDSDLCDEGNIACNGTALYCTDTSGNDLDTCDGLNNDCNLGTPDGFDDPVWDDPCDGADLDTCQEGNMACDGLAMVCDDTTDRSLENVCNGVDDDCDTDLYPPLEAVVSHASAGRNAVAAYGGTQIGVVWTDYRDGSAPGELGAVYFARLTLDGENIAGSEIALTASQFAKAASVVYMSGLDQFAVTWMQGAEGIDMDIEVAFLDASGAEQGRANVSSTPDNNSWFPEIAYSPTLERVAIAWWEFGDCNNVAVAGQKQQVCVALVESPNLVKASSLTDIIGTPLIEAVADDIIWADDRFVAAYTYRNPDREVYIQDLVFNGSDVLTSALNPKRLSDLSFDSQSIRLAYDQGSSQGLAIWKDIRHGNNQTYYSRWDFNGAVGSNTRVSVDATQMTYSAGNGHVVLGSGEYLVAWYAGPDSDVFGQRISTAGVRQGATVRITNDPSTTWSVRLMWTGSFYGLGVRDARNGPLQPHFARFACIP